MKKKCLKQGSTTFPLKSCIKCTNKDILTEQVSVKETIYCNRKTFPWQKQISVTEKKVYVTETSFCQTIISLSENNFFKETSFHHRKTFLSEFPSEKYILVTEKKVSVTEKSFFQRIYLAIYKIFCQRKKLPSQKQGKLYISRHSAFFFWRKM